ncbi:ABC transporter permease [Saccharicrinis aurantiacus]|uniref:ABC transporter permease n=1 Tax=Saccharicrinis aurantiacus TaxID=1849719 RepID=UPI0024933F3A|nr:ABC transporter permease [Saccharicrinis aurantiacus]
MKTFFRTYFNRLIKNSTYSVITILGFSAAITFALLLGIYLKQEFSVNKQQVNSERIYRLTHNMEWAGWAPPIIDWISEKVPEVESGCRIGTSETVVTGLDNQKHITNILFADSTFLQMFSFNLIEGNSITALQHRNNVIISKAYAVRVFGDKSPIGQTISFRNDYSCTVTGVIENYWEDSSFAEADVILNFMDTDRFWMREGFLNSPGTNNFSLFLLEKEHSNLPSQGQKIFETLEAKDFWLIKQGYIKQCRLEPLSETYFSSIQGDGVRRSNKSLLSVLSLVVILVLVLAIINYINLAIAQAEIRVRNMAIRKLVGSTRTQLVFSHIAETTITLFIATAFSFILASACEPLINDILSANIHLANEISLELLLQVLGIIIGIGVISGIIPALIITKQNALQLLKGETKKKGKVSLLQYFICTQFVVVIVLITSALFIQKQTDYLLNQNLGYNTSNIAEFPLNMDSKEYNALKEQLLQIPDVKNVAFVTGSPMDGGNNNSFEYNGKPVSFQVFGFDKAFMDMMQFKITPTGTAYSKDAIYLNRTAIKELDLDDLPTSFKQYEDGDAVDVIGVIEDFTFRPMHMKMGPAKVWQRNESAENPDGAWTMFVEVGSGNPNATMTMVLDTYKKFTGIEAMEYRFMDAIINDWYTTERSTAKAIYYFTILTIIIASMGIFAISVFFMQKRIKEIGIRKVNGATITEICLMLNHGLFKWVVVSLIIATPITYWGMNQWLEKFAFRISLSPTPFLIGGALCAIIVAITVSVNTIKSAKQNPIEALRYE